MKLFWDRMGKASQERVLLPRPWFPVTPWPGPVSWAPSLQTPSPGGSESIAAEDCTSDGQEESRAVLGSLPPSAGGVASLQLRPGPLVVPLPSCPAQRDRCGWGIL